MRAEGENAMIVYDACGQTPSFMLLTKMRPSEPFTVFACRAVHDELALLFTVLFGPELETMRLVPPGLDIWQGVRFEISDDVPAGTIVFASRAAFTYETVEEWRDNAWLVEIVNVSVLAPPSGVVS